MTARTNKVREHLLWRTVRGPVKHADHAPGGLNGRLALWVTNHVGTMWCAYIFAVIGITGVIAALTSNTVVVLIVAAVSGYFLQLVLLPVIIVGQNIQARASDERSEQTYRDVEAILDEMGRIRDQLTALAVSAKR